MLLEKPLDFTIPHTLSTLESGSQTINIIVTSLLAVLILANIGSVISKLIYFTRTAIFDYNCWLRAFIFANSDDPLRILSWLRRKYDYRDPNWVRGMNHLRVSRLTYPLLARTAILLASVASVAVSFPREKTVSGCVTHDYSLRWNKTQARMYFNQIVITCSIIPLESGIGSLSSTASYCKYTKDGTIQSQPGSTLLTVRKSRLVPFLVTVLEYRQNYRTLSQYFAWNDLTKKDMIYLSNIDSLDLDTQLDIAVMGISRVGGNCRELNRTFQKEIIFDSLTAYLEDCNLGDGTVDLTANAIVAIESFIRTALVWKRISSTDHRMEVGLLTGEYGSYTRTCPVKISVSSPVMNIVPLAIALLIFCVVNVLVSYLTSKKGHNSLDASFHIVKEALGHDCTSNPLEENVARNEIMRVNLYKWCCGNSNTGHIGYIGREGDYAVEEFDEGVVVGGCGKAKADLQGRITSTGVSPLETKVKVSGSFVLVAKPASGGELGYH